MKTLMGAWVAAALAAGAIVVATAGGASAESVRSQCSSDYAAAKAGLEGMSKAFALDFAAKGVRSNTIAPTFIETPMTKPFFENKPFLESVLAKIKLGRLGVVEDIMGAIVYLASDASALVTGTSIVVDGGWTAD